MRRGPEHRPGDPTPAPGLYHEINTFGTPTAEACPGGPVRWRSRGEAHPRVQAEQENEPPVRDEDRDMEMDRG